MNFLPQASGTRPRIACEISAQGVVAARSQDATAPLSAVARVTLAEGAVAPGLKPGNIVDRVAVAAALRKALEAVELKAGSRADDITLVIPDSAVRVLLLDFDSLPGKALEALPLVRFRLKKLLPFDADDAIVSYQTMSSTRGLVRVLAVAVPRDVLAEYETAAREAGFEPGAVLPSTLAALAAVDSEEPSLIVNANTLGVTTAIVRNGILLLHRSVDLQQHEPTFLPALLDTTTAPMLPLVDEDTTLAEWAAQQPVPEHGRNPYSDRLAAEEAVQSVTSLGDLPEPSTGGAATALDLQGGGLANDVAQAVSVAAAYFEDTLAISPGQVLSAGPLGAERLAGMLRAEGVGPEDGLRVRELVESANLLSEAVTASVPRAWLSSVMGALRS